MYLDVGSRRRKNLFFYRSRKVNIQENTENGRVSLTAVITRWPLDIERKSHWIEHRVRRNLNNELQLNIEWEKELTRTQFFVHRPYRYTHCLLDFTYTDIQ